MGKFKTIISVLILFMLNSVFVNANTNNKFFKTKDIVTETTINDIEYYVHDFDHEQFNQLYRSAVTFTKFVKTPLRSVYNVDYKEILTISGQDTIPFYKFKICRGCFVGRRDIFIPKRIYYDYKKDFKRTLDIGIIKYAYTNNKEKNRLEIKNIKNKTIDGYEIFLKEKAIEIYNNDEDTLLENKILRVITYVTTLIDYDLKLKGSNTKKSLENNKGVCANYTEIFRVMMDTIASIEPRIQSNRTLILMVDWNSKIESHICNIIEIDNHSYQIDVTIIYPYCAKDLNHLSIKNGINDSIFNRELYDCVSIRGLYQSYPKTTIDNTKINGIDYRPSGVEFLQKELFDRF